MPIPSEFIAKLKSSYPENWGQILQSFSIPKPGVIRINALKITIDAGKQLLNSLGIKNKQDDSIPEALILSESTNREITSIKEYQDGYFYIQSLSSMLPVIALDPQPSETILDMAAAPGSKTSQMAAMMNNEGTIIANDIDQNRIYKLKSVLRTLGVTNTKVTRIPGERLWQTYPEYFDKVLLDAPCSMEGRFNTNDPKTFESWSLKKVKSLAKLQKWMLRSAISATKVGGVIVYSTCTLSREENDEVVDWILDKEKNNVTLLEEKLILPDALYEGFFIAKLRKINSNIA